MSIPHASPAETAGVVADVLAPLVARGAIIRRPKVLGALARADADRRAIRRLQRLDERHGPGPVLLRLPARQVAFVLSPDHVRVVLDGSPEPFATATVEKRGALERFQPHGVLVSHGPQRAERRRFNEEVLDTQHPDHRLAADLVAVVGEEIGPVLAAARRAGGLGWDDFAPAWWRIVRRVVLGQGARDDEELTDLLTRLRAEANWSGLKPDRAALRERFLDRLGAHLARAEPGSLASLVAAVPSTAQTAPTEQVPQWLFAFDAAGMAAFQTLALLAAHPAQAQRARDDLPYTRACVLEAVRLWPTTPAVLRDTTAETFWEQGTLPAGTGLVIFAPFFHRDERRVRHADAFAPGQWLDGEPPDGSPPGDYPLIPFSAGPAACPGRNLVLLLTSTLLAALLQDGGELRQLEPEPLERTRPLPATLSPFRLRFALV